MGIWKNILLVILSPRVGWEDVNVGGVLTHQLLKYGFYPLLAALGVASFMPMLYDHTITLSMSVMMAIINVSSYFFSYYIVNYLLGGFYPALVKTKGAMARLNDFILYSLIYLVMLEIIHNVLPIDFTPIFFLMTYLVWIVNQGSHYLEIEKGKENQYIIVASAMLILTPVVITKLLGMLVVN